MGGDEVAANRGVSMSDTRPHFDLVSYEDKTLPEGKQLFSLEALQDHTIRAVVSDPSGELYCHVVFVTETNCWVAVEAEMAGFCAEDGVDIKVCGDSWSNKVQTLSQYLSVADMKYANLATPGELAALQAIEDKKAADEKAKKAAQLRRELSELEGGAK
jgi:hypothetical protein